MQFNCYNNQDKIYWQYLSFNLSAIQLLRENQEKIHWWNLSENPNIFIDYNLNNQRLFKNQTIYNIKTKDILLTYAKIKSIFWHKLISEN